MSSVPSDDGRNPRSATVGTPWFDPARTAGSDSHNRLRVLRSLVDSLSPDHVPVYDTPESGRALWERCARDGRPVIAVRDGARGFVVRYDLQHLDVELSPRALRSLRERVLAYRREEPVPDAVSQVERHGGETGPVSGELHESTLAEARTLASHLAETVFDRSNWTPASD